LYWHKYRHIDQGNRTESLETDSQTYGQLTCGKGVKVIHEKRKVPSTMLLEKLNIHKEKNEHQLLPHITHKINCTLVIILTSRKEAILRS